MNQGLRKQLELAGIVIIVIIALVVVTRIGRPTPSTTVSPSNVAPSQVSTPLASDSSGNSQTYNDGSYTAGGTYRSPGGNESIEVSVTLKDGSVVSTKATSKATGREGEEYQQKFISSYATLVVGKSLDSINLSRVSGSSLTSQGFNSALTQIKAQAKS